MWYEGEWNPKIENWRRLKGTPVKFYDQKYMNDYYGLPKDNSYYLPEVTVTPKKERCGGKLKKRKQ